MRSLWRWTLAAGAVALCAGTFPGCRRNPPARITLANVERCERGLELAATKSTLQESQPIYYRECAEIYAEPRCRQAYLQAATQDLDKQLAVTLEGCALAYCPIFAGQSLEACSKGFKSTPESLWRAWPPFQKAMLSHDSGPYLPRLERALLQYHATMMNKPGAVPKPEGAAEGDAAAADAAAADAAAAVATDAGKDAAAGAGKDAGAVKAADAGAAPAKKRAPKR